MGSPLGPLLDDKKYVDDTLTIMPNKTSANNFLETFNHCNVNLTSVKFTMEMENNAMLLFLGTQLLNKSSHIETKVYVKLTNSGLLLHYKSHVGDTYKRGLLKTMLDCTFRLSSNWAYFSEDCDRLKVLFSCLKYPDKLINSTITRFIAVKASYQPVPPPIDTYKSDRVHVVLPFKDQASADILSGQLKDLSEKIGTTIQPVFVSHKS